MTFRVFLATHWGDVASLAGLALTIWAVLKAKKAAEQARDAAQQVKERIASLDTLADVSAAGMFFRLLGPHCGRSATTRLPPRFGASDTRVRR